MQPSHLRRAGAQLGVPLDEDQMDRLIRYVGLLEQWNARFNLISRRDVGRIWSRHVLDSLSIAPLLRLSGDGQLTPDEKLTAVDIGSGAGFPGIPLAIADPHIEWHLIDRNQRKVRFLETVIAALGLENAAAYSLDLGAEAPRHLLGRADIVVSRAVDDPAGLVPLAEPLLGAGSRMILMTGASGTGPTDRRLPDECTHRVSAVHDLIIPGLDRTHEVTIIERVRT